MWSWSATGNDGEADEVTLHILESKDGRLRKVGTPSQARYGHNDPDFRPDGTKIAFTYVDNAGTNGDPKIGIFTCRSKSNCTRARPAT